MAPLEVPAQEQVLARPVAEGLRAGQSTVSRMSLLMDHLRKAISEAR